MIQSVKSYIFFSMTMLLSFQLQGNDATWQYIEQYKHIAINEMHRIKIPASIKMAQAILESNSGRSTLAKQSNNHFGIKCGKGWTGAEVYREDDDYENGLLIRSCFRAFNDPAQSFYEHSDFLANPHSKRYGFLFDLDIYDYKAWARGLKKAGYATDPKYPSKLINIIETYSLYELDTQQPYEEEMLASVDAEASHQSASKPQNTIDNVPVISSATSTSIGQWKSGTHKVKTGESMAMIASKYQIDLKELYFQNRMPFGSQAQTGESLVLNEYLHFKKRPKLVMQKEASSRDEIKFLFEETITIASR